MPDNQNLKPDPRNAREHDGHNKAVIRQALQEVGPFRSIAVDGDDIVRAGNGVFEQATEMGLKIRVVEAGPNELIAVKRSDLRGELAERAAIFDNYAGDSSDWDAEMLALLQNEAPGVIEGVFDEGELEAILADHERIEQAEREIKEGGRSNNMAGFMDKSRIHIRPVVTVDTLIEFERALHATGIENRGSALLTVCKFYLEHGHDQNNLEQSSSEGQLDVQTEELLKAIGDTVPEPTENDPTA